MSDEAKDNLNLFTIVLLSTFIAASFLLTLYSG